MTSKRFALLWLLVATLVAGHNAWLWFVQRVVPDTDILALLPVQERDPVLQQSFQHMVDAAQQRVVVLVGATDWVKAKQAADAYRKVLGEQPSVLAATALNDKTQDDWLQLFHRHRSVLLTAAQERQLREQSPQAWSETALGGLYGAFGGPKVGSWQDDPYGLFAGWVQQRAQETPVRPRDGQLFVGDGKMQYVLLPLELKLPAFSIAAQETVLPLLARAAGAARAAVPEADLVQAGVILHAAAASAQAQREMHTIGAGSLLGIVLLTWLVFRSVRPIVMVLLSISVGVLGAFSACWLIFGQVHLMTLVFGASLIGVAQDYGIDFLCNRMEADPALDSRALLRRLLPALVLTLLAAVIGYAGLAFTPFPGLRAMAVFSALGLAFAWMTVMAWFPLCVPGGVLRQGPLVAPYVGLLAHWPRWPFVRAGAAPKARLLFGVACAAACTAIGAGVARLAPNDDIRLLQNSPKALLESQLRLGRLLDAATPAQYFLVRGASEEEVLQREEGLKQQLDPLIAAGVIGGYQAMSNWVPSARTQAARRALLQAKLFGDDGPLAAVAGQVGEDRHWIAATRAHAVAGAAPLALEAFLSAPASEPWRHLWLGRHGKEFASIVALRGMQYGGLPRLQRAADGLTGVQWVDKVGEISSVLGRYRSMMAWVVGAAYAVVFLLLLPRYRGGAWRVLAPTALASVATLAMFGWFGMPLQLFHVLALMLLLGVGVDYGVFMAERASRGPVAPWLAVGMSAANAILGFGLLGLSGTPALRAFGLTMLLGTALVWLLVPCFVNIEDEKNVEAA
ncbi:MMPL family transporter [Pseudoduganella violaceinigra]|uniref:MMPL family transporter n=1 Tax=Pseudoduganella violaceinigra TaxID=246602 RepID=UPI0003F4AFEF|nr:MMPL family transporter [Pseudoduganella violaceinigra]